MVYIYTTLLLIITLRFAQPSKTLKILWTYCLQNFIFLFMTLLTALIVESNHILAGIYFIFRKNVLDQTWMTSNVKFRLQWKDWESSCQVRQISLLFSKLVALISNWNCVKGPTVTKILKQIKSEVAWGKVEARNLFQRQSFTKYLR